MGRNSETRQYPSAKSGENKSSSHSVPPRAQRKRSAKKIVLAVTVALLVAMILMALVFVIRDMALQERNGSGNVPPSSTPSASSTSAPADNTQAASPDRDPSKHPVAYAIDSDGSTYMISEKNQAVGAYLLLELNEKTSILSVEILSNDLTAYIRGAMIQTSNDAANWDYFGTYTGAASDGNIRAITTGSAVETTFVRLILTEKADVQWVVNTIRVLSQDNAAVAIRSATLGVQGSGTVVTDDPAGTTSVPPAGNTVKTVQNTEVYRGNLIVVNAVHAYSFPAGTADILPLYDGRPQATLPNGSTVTAYKVGGSALPALQATALKAFNDMAKALVEETGVTQLEIGENNAWRSRETQENLYTKYPTSASPAGQSEHNTGLGINITLMDENGGIYYLNETGANKNCATVYSWLTANAHKYGFVERFQTAKKSITGVVDDYHYRYVGYVHAYYMKQNNLCLEEYVEMLHNYPFNGTHLNVTGDNGKSYEIYYVPLNKNTSATELQVPADKPYTVSGDNYSGFIITVEN